MFEPLAKRLIESRLPGIDGRLTVVAPSGDATEFGHTSADNGSSEPLRATLCVHDERLYRRVLLGSDIGLGEAYMDGDWSSPDVVALTRLLIRNAAKLEGDKGLSQFLHRHLGLLARRLRDNSITGSRRHIREHYDLSNDFFKLFLDDSLMYSSAYYETGFETLEQAQQTKLDLICRKLDLRSSDDVLEIGTGWGGFAAWAATRYGCRVTTTTISAEQYRHARSHLASLGEVSGRVTVLEQDYRLLTGQFDKIVSIEMFEAVGFNHYDEFFRAVDRLLKPHGSMLIQTITVDEQRFTDYRRSPDWIEKYIFPGGELVSLGEVMKSLGRATSLSMYHAENFGTHYARTLREWRARFRRRLAAIRALGFSERFIRMWDLYLAFCEAAFLERHTGVFHLVLNKNYGRAALFNEPWMRERESESAAVA